MKVIGQNLWRIGFLWLIWVAATEVLPAQNLPTDDLSKVTVVEYEWSEYSEDLSPFPRRFPSGVFNQSYVSRSETPDCYSQGLSNPCALTQRREKQFVYQVKIRNAGEKQIIALDWNYVFIDPDTEKIISRHSFYTQTQIQPHKSKTLSEILASPPTRIIDIRMLGKNPASKFTERILVNSVVFRDGQSRQIITREIK